MTGTVSAIYVYPVPGEPGRALSPAIVTEAGLDGDRHRGAPISIVTADVYAASAPRANLVVELTPAELDELIGHRMLVGEVALELVERNARCGLVYAVVAEPGSIRTGDSVGAGEPSH
ncbi:MAG: hypothetical protein WAW82_00565 [Candidatus Lutibacillus vidarii]